MNLQSIKVSETKQSMTNTKGRTEGPAFDDLVKSIKEKGVLVPVLARKLEGKDKVGKWEVIAGNRRLAAAREAGLEEIPAKIVEMTDDEAREAQIVENLQRQDIHPLDEGKAYRELVEASKQDLEAIAVKVGKSIMYVRDRLLLTNLISKAVKEFKDGKIHAGHAALIARLSEKMQKRAIEWLDGYGEHTTADLREWIQNNLLSEIVPWKDDEKLVEAVGGCEECKGKGGDLFGKKAAESCTNPKCYAQRIAAYIQIKTTENPELVRVSMSYGRSEKEGPLSRSEYSVIDSKKDACDMEKKGIVVEGEGMGRIIRFCNDPVCKKHAAQHSDTPYKLSDKEKEARKKEKQKQKALAEKQTKEFQKAILKVKDVLPVKHVTALFEFAMKVRGFSQQQPLAKLLGLEPIKSKEMRGWSSETEKEVMVSDWEKTLRKYADDNGAAGKMRVVFGLLMPHPSQHDSESFSEAIKKL